MKIQTGDRFRNEYGVWQIAGPASGGLLPGQWEIFLESRGRNHCRVADEHELTHFFTREKE